MTSALVLSNSIEYRCRLLHTHSLPFQWCTKGMAKKASQGLLSSCHCFSSGKLLSSFALLRVFSSNSVSCHPDLHLFAGRPPVHPCLQTKAPLELCLPAGWPREGTDCRRRKKLHLAEGTLPFLNGRHGLKQKARPILVGNNDLLCTWKIAASKWLAKRKQDKLKKRHLAEDILPFLQTTSKTTRDFKTKSLGMLVDDEAHGQITVWQKEKKKVSLQRWWERFKAQTTCNDKSKCLTPSLKTWWSNNDNLINNHLEYTL